MRNAIFFLLLGFSMADARAQDISIIKTPSSAFLDSVMKGLAFRISGTVKGHDANRIYFLNDRLEKIDSAVVQDGRFEFTGIANEPSYINSQLSGSYYIDQFFLENGELNVSIGAKPYTFLITGGPENEKDNEFSSKAEGMYDQLYSFEDSIKQAKKSADINQFIFYIDSCKMVEKAYLSLVRQQIDSSNFGFYLLNAINSGIIGYSYFEERLSLFNRLPAEIRDSKVGKKSFSYLLKAKPDTSKAIQKAASFTLSNINGRKISLNSFKGSYLLIDFWASWCIPCLEELPLLKEIYTHYNPAGVRFLSISIDKNKSDWQRMEKKSMLKSASVLGNKDISIKYGVNAIPKKVLIDPSGNVIGTGLSLEKTYRMLSELK